MMRLPVMDPFARTLTPDDIGQIAKYLSELPELPELPIPSNEARPAEHARGASLYAQHCASCHGAVGEGQDGIFASRLCGQYAGYLNRRLEEAASRSRGDADAIMQGVLDLVPSHALPPIVVFLAEGRGCQPP
jgi:cytochrome c553